MRPCGLLMAVLLAGCLPDAVVDPSTCKVDPSLEGIWLAKGDLLEQCVHGDVEYGPGSHRSASGSISSAIRSSLWCRRIRMS